MQNNDIRSELGQNFIEYAVAVNSDRAIPDAKSGLKPVAKRILWSAFEEGRLFSKPHVKSARIVGDVMGKYHPHGDSSIYGAMVRLSQSWTMRYPLIDWHGSNGNIAGDGPAASRYTEARLSKLAEDGMLTGLKKKNVDFIDNYDETLLEPVTLPSIFPNLLCNPNTGIGVAIACNWLPHNLNEVADAINMYLNGEEPVIPGPDFPTGGVIINKNDLPNIVASGRGTVRVRGQYKFEKNNIVFYEIPYGTNTETIMTQIGEVADKDIEGILSIRDESNKKGLRLVIECSKTANLNYILNLLFRDTDLQTSISYNQVALIGKTPTELTLKDCIKIYVDHNIDCITRETRYDLEKALDRLHIVNGLLKALEDIDNIIALIKKSASGAAAKEALIAQYGFTEAQAKAILAMRLSSLANLEKVELQNEQAELNNKIDTLNALVNNYDLQVVELKNRLADIVKKYGDARRTELAQIEVSKEDKEIVAVEPEDVVVAITQSGLIKRVPTASYRTQKRNGVGIKNGDDIIQYLVKTNTIDTLMVFSSKGKMYRLLVDKIPEGTNSSKGVPVSALINMETGESPMAYASLYRDTTAKFVFFVTKNGIIKKVPISEYSKTKKGTGILALTLKDGDELADVTFIEKEEMLLITKKGMVIRFVTDGMPISSRTAQGVKGISLNADDTILTCLPIKHSSDNLMVISEVGFGKQVSLTEFTVQGRGGKGVTCYKGELAGAALVSDNDDILVVGDKNTIRVSASDLPNLGRVGIGNTVIKNNKVRSISKI